MLCEDYAEIVDEEDADYSSPTRDFELDRSRVDLTEIIGEGQFGDVYRGVYTPASAGLESVPVAVKTCKIDQDGSMADKFLEEACKFYKHFGRPMFIKTYPNRVCFVRSANALPSSKAESSL